jgi:hypothetical protein
MDSASVRVHSRGGRRILHADNRTSTATEIRSRATELKSLCQVGDRIGDLSTSARDLEDDIAVSALESNTRLLVVCERPAQPCGDVVRGGQSHAGLLGLGRVSALGRVSMTVTDG